MHRRLFIKTLLILTSCPFVFLLSNKIKIKNKKKSKLNNYVWIMDVNEDFK